MNFSGIILNNTTPGQRALLFAVLEAAKQENENSFQMADCTGQQSVVKEFHGYAVKEINLLQQLFFQDCFIEQEDFIKAFAMHRLAAKAAAPQLITG